MGTPYLGEMRIFSFNFNPKGWALCNGQLLPINQNQPLFALLGTTYGGDGRTNFALPNLQGSVALGMGSGYVQGQIGGEINHTLVQNELPTHIHPLVASSAAAALPSAVSDYPATLATATGYMSATPTSPVSLTSSSSGGGQPHSNQQPYITLEICIALQGIFPSRN